MYSLHLVAKTYGRLPSEIMGLSDHPALAWMFDDQVMTFGLYIDSRLRETDKKGKPKHKLADLLRERRQGGTVNVAALSQIRGVKVREAGDG